MSSLNLMNSYLTNSHQRIKVNNSYSLCIKYCVPQGSILGPVLFNIFLWDLFFIINDVDVASYADGNTPYTHGKFLSKIFEKLECTSRDISEWFFNNTMKVNPDKCHFLSYLDMNTKMLAVLTLKKYIHKIFSVSQLIIS